MDTFERHGQRHRLIDCFLFYNELDMLEYRLNVLNGSIDYFVIVEANLTFMGRPKPLFYDINRSRFADYSHKIVHVRVDDLPYPDPEISSDEQWANEHHQRDAVVKGLERVPDLSNSDIVLLSDVDEIFDPVTLRRMRHDADVTIDDLTLYSFRQKYMCYNINTVRDLDWFHPKAFTVGAFRTTFADVSPSDLRMRGVTQRHDGSMVLFERGGWHLSYFGTTEFIANKIKNFSHQEFNAQHITDEGAIERRLKDGTDVMDRECIKFNRVPVCRNPYLPPSYDTLLKNYTVS